MCRAKISIKSTKIFNRNGEITMLKPIQLPSGKIIDLDKCLAIFPSSTTSTDTELVLAGIEHHIPIDSTDAEMLSTVIRQQIVSQPRYAFEFRTIVQESQRQEQLSEKLKLLRQKREELSHQPDADKVFKMFAEIVDAERTTGQKLYSLQ
jgi:hypothetical protein